MGNDFKVGVWGRNSKKQIKVCDIIFMLGTTKTGVLKGKINQ